MPQTRNRYVLRYLLFFISIFIMALGIALTTRANLGTTPITALPYVASLGFTPSLGFFTILLNVALVALQIALLGKKFPKIQLLQLPALLFFGLFIDFWMALISGPASGLYAHQLLYLGVGVIILAFGIFMEVSANVVMMAGEGAVVALSLVTRRDFGTLKVVFDSTLVLMGVLLSFAVFGELQGIREGTVVSALTLGLVVKFFFAARKRFAGGERQF